MLLKICENSDHFIKIYWNLCESNDNKHDYFTLNQGFNIELKQSSGSRVYLKICLKHKYI